tara:strand:+ start:547 stop:831 length:285 start_codon:yes stop_codon:yes gene_type:complete
MGLSLDQVKKIAKLSRIKMTDDQLKNMRVELENIFNHIDVIQKAATENIEPTGHSVNLDSVFRDDVVEKSAPVKEVLKNAPKQDDDFFTVRKII